MNIVSDFSNYLTTKASPIHEPKLFAFVWVIELSWKMCYTLPIYFPESRNFVTSKTSWNTEQDIYTALDAIAQKNKSRNI